LQSVRKLQEHILGAEHPETLMTRMNLALASIERQKYAEAEAEFRSVLKARERVLGLGHRDTVKLQYNLAHCLDRQGKLEEARLFADRAAEGARKVLDPDHPDTIDTKPFATNSRARKSPPASFT